MIQSKMSPLEPIIFLGTNYSKALVSHPLLVKSITSGLLSALGNFLGQRITNKKSGIINIRSISAFGIFGFGITGPFTHYFLNWLEHYGPSNQIFKLFIDRFIYGPIFLLLALYLLSRLEGSSHQVATKQLQNVYWSALQMMWKVWIIVQYVNLNFVPLQYRVLVANIVSVGWNIILSRQRLTMKKKQDE